MSAYQQLIVIESAQLERHYWRDFWRHRELLYFLAWRDVVVRYKQTSVGVAWALVRPLIAMIVFTVLFGKLAKLPSGEAPYAIMVFAALLPWQLFASAFSDMGISVVNNAGVISKVYFPRMIVPLSVILVALVDFAVASTIFVGLMIWYQYLPDWRVITLPLFVLLAVMTVIGPGFWIASLTVKYRDFRYIVPFIVQLGMYISPVGFNSAVIPEHFRLLYSLNPMVGVIDGFRWALLRGDGGLYVPGLLLSAVLATLMLVGGIIFFRRAEQTFADII